jgi:hypothetical protein
MKAGGVPILSLGFVRLSDEIAGRDDVARKLIVRFRTVAVREWTE